MSAIHRLPFTSLNAATGVGPGAAFDVEGVANEYTVTSTVTGSPASVSVFAEGSHDGVNWFAIAGTSLSATSGTSASGTSGTPTHHFRYIRSYLSTLSGGSSPTVTSTIAVG